MAAALNLGEMVTAPAGSTTLTPSTEKGADTLLVRLPVELALNTATSPEPGVVVFQLVTVDQRSLVAPVHVCSVPAAKVEAVMAHSEAQAMREERVRGENAGWERSGAFIGVFGMAGVAWGAGAATRDVAFKAVLDLLRYWADGRRRPS